MMAEEYEMITYEEMLSELHRLRKELDDETKLLKRRGRVWVRYEKKYKIELAKEITILRVDKTPATVIGDLARGNEKVAKLRFKRDLARSQYNTTEESIRTIKTNIRILENEIAAIRNGRG